MTGHRSFRLQPGVPAGTWGHTEAEFEKALADIALEDFSALVLERAAGELSSRQGWGPAPKGQKADAVLLIRIENMCFCSPDALSEVAVQLALKVVLTEGGSDDVLWRDCLNWSFAGLYSSLQDLARADAAQQEELFADLAARLLDRLAEHLASQVPKG